MPGVGADHDAPADLAPAPPPPLTQEGAEVSAQLPRVHTPGAAAVKVPPLLQDGPTGGQVQVGRDVTDGDLLTFSYKGLGSKNRQQQKIIVLRFLGRNFCTFGTWQWYK